MGFGLQHFHDNTPKKKQKNKKQMILQDETKDEQQDNTQKQQNDEELINYYKQMIQSLIKENPLVSDKLAITLILTRTNKATITNNRNLILLDIDKLMHLQKPLISNQLRKINLLKKAISQSPLQVNLMPSRMVEEVNTGNMQIFRLVRAAQMRLLTTNNQQNRNITAQTTRNVDDEIQVNRSFDFLD